jgi:hypothetical protein
MPVLLNLSNSSFIAREYFKNVYYNGSSRKHEYKVAETYPYEVYVHVETQADDDPEFLIDLRRFVQRQAAGDAVYQQVEKNYWYAWNHGTVKSTYELDYDQIQHHYWVIHFELESDMTMFKLIKPMLVVTEMSKFKPGYDYHTDENTKKHSY